MIQWIEHRGPDFILKSQDGYYAIQTSIAGRPGEKNVFGYRAYHIEGLWAKPRKIAETATIADAKQACQQHQDSPPS